MVKKVLPHFAEMLGCEAMGSIILEQACSKNWIPLFPDML
jgi:hypothetical protein